jgi:hypothetical protein
VTLYNLYEVNMTLYSNNITSSEIGGAIAEAILHDIRVNNLGIEGFPLIHVVRQGSSNFSITLKFSDKLQEFSISNAEAVRAVALMKSMNGHCSVIFERVTTALANLEGS